MVEFDLKDRLALITGGASGIGLAVARRFHAAGARIGILDLNGAEAERVASGLGSQHFGIGCNVAELASVQQAFQAVDAIAPVDILVNSAGVAHVGTVLSTAPDDFNRLFQVNVRGTYHTMQSAAERMVSRRLGVILNLASIAATAGLQDRFAYSMTKGAVLSMTLSAARDLMPHGVRCNCISPARIHTPFVDGFVARNYPGREAEQMQKLEAAQPIGRMGRPDEVASLALYLCSDASAFVTGADFPLDGGFFNLR